MEARMPIRIRRGWEIPDRLATPEHLVFGRRGVLKAAAAAGAIGAAA
jgi:methionine sulfoxide reductase catalytic subunit